MATMYVTSLLHARDKCA